jgi:hypothetical protein
MTNKKITSAIGVMMSTDKANTDEPQPLRKGPEERRPRGPSLTDAQLAELVARFRQRFGAN